ncbi:hypothetical protein lbkm_2555 [Lachnospiraceae bacterium KM106-2]|nr:hypothetical protein lbkm_2555 [Lachnospiraceae bacterium KM106-2]
MITAGMRIDKFVEDMICTDFIISDESFFSASNVDVPDMSKNQKQIEKLNQTNGVLDHGAAYKRTIDHRLSKKALMKFDRIMNQDIVESSPMSDQLKDMKLGIKPINLDLYGLDSYVIRLLEAREGTIDIRKFNKGGYVMVSGFVESDTGESCYKPGDKMTIQYPNGNKKEYTVMAIADLPDSLTAGGISMAGFQAFIPCSEWSVWTGWRAFFEW